MSNTNSDISTVIDDNPSSRVSGTPGIARDAANSTTATAAPDRGLLRNTPMSGLLQPLGLARPVLPQTISFGVVAAGATTAGRNGGNYSLSDGSATARLAGTDSLLFKILKVATFDVELDPGGLHGNLMVLVPALSVDGAGPIAVDAGQAVQVTVQFTCPADPPERRIAAAVVLDGIRAGGLLLDVTPNTGVVEMKLLGSPGVLAGQSQELVFQVSSSRLHDVTGVLTYDASLERHFSSPRMTISIPAGSSFNVTVPVSSAADTPAGQAQLFFNLFDVAEPRLWAQAIVDMAVMSVVASISDSNSLEKGSFTALAVTGQLPVMPGTFSIDDSGFPEGVAITGDRQAPIDEFGVFSLRSVLQVAPNAVNGIRNLAIHWSTRTAQGGTRGDASLQVQIVDCNPIAVRKIGDLRRRTGADFGPLGVPLGAIQRDADGRYSQSFQLGNVHLTDLNGTPNAETSYITTVTLAAVKCFGTQDADHSDSTYLVISVFAIDPNHKGSDTTAATIRTAIVDHVHEGDVPFKAQTLADVPLPVGSGLVIHVSVWDHESGNADDIRDRIASSIEDAVKKGAAALGSAAAADDPQISGGTIGKITDFEVGGVKPFHVLTLGLASLIANAVADDLVGEKIFNIPAGNIALLSDPATFNQSVRRDPDLPFDVQLNWPPTFDDEKDFVFTDGHGTYKVYFLIKTAKVTTPLTPGLTA